MPTATYNKFNCLVADIANKVHNLGSDQLAVALTDVAPVATNTVLSNITQIASYPFAGVNPTYITTTSSTQTTGLYKLILANLTLTANGGVPQFRYAVVYNYTAGSKNLIGWFDYASEANMSPGETFAVNFDQTNGLLQLT